MTTPFAKTGVRDPFKCFTCGHSSVVHDKNGCKVVRLETGQKCDCVEFKNRSGRERYAKNPGD